MSLERNSYQGSTFATLYPMASGVTTSFVGNPLDISLFEGHVSVELVAKGCNGSTLDLKIIPSGVTGLPGVPVATFSQVTSTASHQIADLDADATDQYIIPSGTITGSVSLGISVHGRTKTI